MDKQNLKIYKKNKLYQQISESRMLAVFELNLERKLTNQEEIQKEETVQKHLQVDEEEEEEELVNSSVMIEVKNKEEEPQMYEVSLPLKTIRSMQEIRKNQLHA